MLQKQNLTIIHQAKAIVEELEQRSRSQVKFLETITGVIEEASD